MLNGKGQVEFARERLVKAVNQVGRSQGEGEEQEGRVGASPHGPGRWEGQREERGRDVRVGLRKPAGGVGRTRRRVEGLPGGPVGVGEGSGGRHHRRHRRPQGVLQGEGREPPRELLDLLPRPREVREGQAPHGRHSGPLHGQDVHGGGFPLRREEDVDLGWSPSSRPRSTWPGRCWTCSRSASACPGSSSTRGTGPRSS
ncbi:hypothetical protein LD85_1849 [Saccharolobus islandicus L.D.8.5]|uniref:Uncharacterized protein n=1 Tax=Saccharolobus islandicus (strain L.D.8.5 / Lassen \|nr:hypothetical protein LD85_1849 [Sulfolobus islandicus L.D.8.5]